MRTQRSPRAADPRMNSVRGFDAVHAVQVDAVLHHPVPAAQPPQHLP